MENKFLKPKNIEERKNALKIEKEQKIQELCMTIKEGIEKIKNTSQDNKDDFEVKFLKMFSQFEPVAVDSKNYIKLSPKFKDETCYFHVDYRTFILDVVTFEISEEDRKDFDKIGNFIQKYFKFNDKEHIFIGFTQKMTVNLNLNFDGFLFK